MQTPLISPSEAFEAVVQASNLYRAGDKRVPISFYIEEGQLASDPSRYLPDAKDESIAGYGKRVSRQINGRRFALIVREVQSFRFSLWQAFRAFLNEFYESAGVPFHEARATVFCGNYRKTPAGVHPGNSGNFKFVVAGRKRMRLWPGQYFRGDPRGDHFLDYEGDLQAGQALVGGPGDVIYWPSDSWHIGENLGKIGLTISLALFVKDVPSLEQEIWNETIRYAEGELRLKGAVRGRSLGHRTDGRRIRQVIAASGKALVSAMADSKVTESIVARWLNRITGFGFDAVPPPERADQLKDGAFIRLDPAYPVKWVRPSAREMICSANGHSFVVSAHPSVERLWRLLNRGGRHRVDHLLDRFAGTSQADGHRFEAKRKDIREVLRKLLSLRAIKLERD